MQIIKGVVAGAAALVCACGTSDEPFTIVLPANQAALIAVQDGDGPWQQLTPDGDGNVTFEVTSGRYGYAYLCDRYGTVQFLTPAVTDPATACRVSTPTFHTISGTTAPDARVITTADDVVADGAGAYSARIRAGDQDVVAVQGGATPRILVMHAVTVAGDMTLDLPLASQGVDMPLVTPTVTGAGTDTVTIYSDLNTAGGVYVWLADDAATVPIAPAAALGPGDGAAVGATASGPDGSRTAQHAAGETAPTLALPDPLGAQVGRDAAGWQGDWDYTGVVLAPPFTTGGSTTWIHYGVTGAWVAAAGGERSLPIVDVTTLPGWQTGMIALPAGQLDWNMWANRGRYDADYDISSGSGTLTW